MADITRSSVSSLMASALLITRETTMGTTLASLATSIHVTTTTFSPRHARTNRKLSGF